MQRDWVEHVKDVARGQFLRGEPMARHTSFKIGGPAELWFVPAGREDFLNAARRLHADHVPYVVVGNGTNILVADAGVPGAVVRLKDGFDQIRVIGGEGKDRVLVEAGAGAALGRLHLFASKKGFIGTEFTFGIPGTIGGAVTGNAGTRLGEMKDIVTEVELLLRGGRPQWIGAAQVKFRYRGCALPAGAVILAVRLRLLAGGKDVATTDKAELKAYRAKAQPWRQPSAGSVFLNPEGDYAGRLIDAAGLKGLRLGDAEVSPVHANFIVNRGRARSAHVRRLMEIVQAEVARVQGVRLEPEIKLLGLFGKEGT